MLVALVSAKGAPGVTSTALCLAAAGRGDGFVVEADPSGGDLECWSGPHGEAGLVSLATSLRPGMTAGDLRLHAVDACPGVRAVTAPTTEAPATAALARVGDQLGAALAGLDVDLLLDAGRWSPTQATAGRVASADVLVVVCRPTLDGVAHARGLVQAAERSVAPSIVAIVVGGDRPYGPGEVAHALGVPVLGVLPWEPRAVLALLDGGGRGWERSRLAAAATDCADAMGLGAAATGVRAGG